MELKSYQKKAINDLKSYLECLDSYGIKEGWNKYWQDMGVNAGKYHDKIKAVPNICVKVTPTGFVVPWDSPSLSGALLCDGFDCLVGVDRKSVV